MVLSVLLPCLNSGRGPASPAVVGGRYRWTSLWGLWLRGAGILLIAGLFCATTMPHCRAQGPCSERLEISSNAPICAGTTLRLACTLVPGASYTWETPTGLQVSGRRLVRYNTTLADSGTYTVQVSRETCAWKPVSIQVAVHPYPDRPEARGAEALCEGDTLFLEAEGPPHAQYRWTGPRRFYAESANTQLPDVSVTSSGTYSVVAVVQGCNSLPATVSVDVDRRPPALRVWNNSPLCEGETLKLYASDLPKAEFVWRGPGGFVSSARETSRDSITQADRGIYTLTASLGGCTTPPAETRVQIEPRPRILELSYNAPLCSNAPLKLEATTDPADAQAAFHWLGPGDYLSQRSAPWIPPSRPGRAGVYSLTLIRGACQSPVDTLRVEEIVLPGPVLAGSNSPLCGGRALELTGLGPDSLTYRWQGPDGFEAHSQHARIGETTDAQSGYYSLTAAYRGCTTRPRTVRVRVQQTPDILRAANNSPICTGEVLRLQATTLPDVEYRWFGPTGFLELVQNPGIAQVSTAQSGTYTVEALLGACSQKATTEVRIKPRPRVPTLANNGPVCQGETLMLTASTLSGAAYQWTGPHGYRSTQRQPQIPHARPRHQGTYALTAEVDGCISDTLFTEVEILACSKRCLPPDTPNVIYVEATEARLRWIPRSSETVCNLVAYGPRSRNPETWAVLLVPGNRQETPLEKLIPGETYGVRVRANCGLCSQRSGQRSIWSEIVEFRTPPKALICTDALPNDIRPSLRVYPNPVAEKIRVSFRSTDTQAGILRFLTTEGREIESHVFSTHPGENVLELDTGGIPSGLFLLELKIRRRYWKTRLLKR